jgi:EAL domain-containing protein (putative c-di-GMP-specific phosphodiesterase class I)
VPSLDGFLTTYGRCNDECLVNIVKWLRLSTLGEDRAAAPHVAVRFDLRAKRAGCRRRMVFVEGHSSRGDSGLALEAALRAALREDRFLFAFQPVVCAATAKVDYFECLLRMRDEQGTIIGGVEFIRTVEDLGLIGLIDHYVLEKTFQELAVDPEVRLGFNISGLTVCNQQWLRSLVALLHGRPEIAHRLVIEITETAAVDDIRDSVYVVDTLRRMGCRVALDDFGAGHTSLRHLELLPLDIVKIDGSIVRKLASNSEDRRLLRHLIGLTKDFGFSTVAECIETAEDAVLLRAEGIGYLQGYFLGRPTIERGRFPARVKAEPGGSIG